MQEVDQKCAKNATETIETQDQKLNSATVN